MNMNENNSYYLSDELEADRLLDIYLTQLSEKEQEDNGRAEYNRPTTIQEPLN